jgi:hypothetical protein
MVIEIFDIRKRDKIILNLFYGIGYLSMFMSESKNKKKITLIFV